MDRDSPFLGGCVFTISTKLIYFFKHKIELSACWGLQISAFSKLFDQTTTDVFQQPAGRCLDV